MYSVYTKSKINQRNQVSREKENANDMEEALSLTFKQTEGSCYCCGKYGHKLPKYHLKDTKPRHEWYINTIQLTQSKKEMSNDQDSATNTIQNTSGSNSDSALTSKTSSKRIVWSNLHYNLSNYRRNKGNELRDLVLLDSDSTNTIFCNRDYVKNIREAKIP